AVVGRAVTHGCIRMYPEDVAAVFALVPVGTKVRLINEPVKVAVVKGQLLIEAHPQVDDEGQSVEPDLKLLSKLLDKAVGGKNRAAIHWDVARQTLQAGAGVPTVVGLPPEPLAHPPSLTPPPPPPRPALAGVPGAHGAPGRGRPRADRARQCWLARARRARPRTRSPPPRPTPSERS